MKKHIVKFGNTTNVSGETINEPAVNLQTGAVAWSPDKSGFCKMNVVFDVKTLSGTNPTIQFSVQETMGGIWVETGKSKVISATGTYLLMQGAAPTGTASVLSDGPAWALGSGMDKRVVTTAGGTVGSLNADIYLDFTDE